MRSNSLKRILGILAKKGILDGIAQTALNNLTARVKITETEFRQFLSTLQFIAEMQAICGEWKGGSITSLIIYVNGYFNDDFPLTSGKKLEEYWGAPSANASAFIIRSKIALKASKSDLFFINGADEPTSSGAKRFMNGRKFVQDRMKNKQSQFYNIITSIIINKGDIKFVSHSMGSAFTEGMIAELAFYTVSITKIVHFSAADKSDFPVGLPEKTYQIDVFPDPVLLYKNLDDAKLMNGIMYACVAPNDEDLLLGHAYTKSRDYVWDWYEDLASCKFSFVRNEKKIIPSIGGMGAIYIDNDIYSAYIRTHGIKFHFIYNNMGDILN